jgi:8-oxo-dGTP pyrophosphatase MutT (NUDIX family)
MPLVQPLVDDLNRYEPTDLAESSHRVRMIELARGKGDPFSRSHFDPGHFTASAFVLSPDSSSLLLIHHSKLHRWLQPGGHVEPEDADLLAAARREIAEEVGIVEPLPLVVDGPFDLDVHPIPARKDEPAHEHFDVRFLFRATSLDAVAGSDATDVRWVPIGQINADTSDESVSRAVRKIRTHC